MAEQRHLHNAPIREALIDFRVKMPPEFQVSEFLKLKEQLHNSFPKFRERRAFRGEFKIVKGKPFETSSKDQGIVGYIFISENDAKIVQFRIDGFTYSRLKPYPNWDEIFNEARGLWNLFIENAKPNSVTRIAVRYINQIDLPLPLEDLEKYLTNPPKIPNNLGCGISGFLTKITTYFPEFDIYANIIQALEKGQDPNHITLILDTDVYKLQDYMPNSEKIWPMFERFHELKNLVFFESITEETARLFE